MITKMFMLIQCLHIKEEKSKGNYTQYIVETYKTLYEEGKIEMIL